MSVEHMAAPAARDATAARSTAAGGVDRFAAVDRWSALDLMERSDTATRHADGSLSIRRDQRAVWFLYGPFWRLPQGRYRLSVHCRSGAPVIRSAVVLGVEVIADARAQVAWRDFTANELIDGYLNIDFVVPPRLSVDAGGGAIFEFRLFHFANADLAVSAVELCRCLTDPAPPAPRRWRLSGRVVPHLARRPDGAGFVALRRWAPAGQFLLGVGPVTGLPAGLFQLRFCCRLEAPRRLRQALLCVEIVSGPLCHSVHFYAAELASGRGCVEFTVPAELGLDGGTPAPVAVRFCRLRHAALAVGDIEIVQIGDRGVEGDAPRRIVEADGQAYQPPGWRLAVDPLRLRLAPGRATLSLYARATEGAAFGIELCNVGQAFPWPRLRRRAGETAAHGSGRNLASPGPSLDARSIDFVVPLNPRGNRDGGGESVVELRIFSQAPFPLALNKLTIKQNRRMSRKNLTIIGNCHASIIYEGFRSVPALQHYFRAGYYHFDLREHLHEAARRDLDACDVLIVQDIADWQDCPLRAWVPDRAETVMFPGVWFASLWPFDGCNGPTDQQAIAQEAPNFTFTYFDGLLARLRQEISDKERRFHAYRSLDVPGVVDYRRLHQFESRRMLALDKRHDCEIGRFILDRFQSEQLFYTTNHPNRRIFEIIIADIMRKLAISGGIPEIPALDQLHSLQVPVHPMVAAALGAGWATPERKYRFRQEELTWEEYVRRYIDLYG